MLGRRGESREADLFYHMLHPSPRTECPTPACSDLCHLTAGAGLSNPIRQVGALLRERGKIFPYVKEKACLLLRCTGFSRGHALYQCNLGLGCQSVTSIAKLIHLSL